MALFRALLKAVTCSGDGAEVSADVRECEELVAPAPALTDFIPNRCRGRGTRVAAVRPFPVGAEKSISRLQDLAAGGHSIPDREAFRNG